MKYESWLNNKKHESAQKIKHNIFVITNDLFPSVENVIASDVAICILKCKIHKNLVPLRSNFSHKFYQATWLFF